MAKTAPADFDRDLADQPAEVRWRMWINRIEAVLFASATPVPTADLERVVGQGVSVVLLIEDLSADIAQRSFEIVHVADGWLLRTRAAYAPIITAAADVQGQDLDLTPYDTAVLAAIAYHQPITRHGLKEIFGKDISRDLIRRLHDRALITTGPRSPQRGAPYTFVTTSQFLTAFDLQNLQELPDYEQLLDAGLSTPIS